MKKILAYSMLRLLSKPSMVCFGPDEDAAAAKAAEDAAAKKAAEDAEKAKQGKTYTQKEVDAMSATQRRSYQKEQEKLVAEMQKLSEDKRLSQEERDKFAKNAEDLEAQYKTQAQLAEEKAKKQETEYKKDLEKSREETKVYKGKYAKTKIENELSQEAAAADEVISGQLKKFLLPDTVLVDEMVDGKPTGEQVVMVKFEDIDPETKKTVTLTLSPKEAMKRMKELPERFGNFFKGVGTGGVGAANSRGGGGGSGKMPEDTGAYMAARKAARA